MDSFIVKCPWCQCILRRDDADDVEYSCDCRIDGIITFDCKLKDDGNSIHFFNVWLDTQGGPLQFSWISNSWAVYLISHLQTSVLMRGEGLMSPEEALPVLQRCKKLLLFS